jgi:hypothetical protein
MDPNYSVNVLSKMNDDPSDLEKYVELLYILQQKRGPLVEVVTVLKNEKPKIYALLKRRIKHNPGLSLLFDLSADYEQAKTVVYGTLLNDSR